MDRIWLEDFYCVADALDEEAAVGPPGGRDVGGPQGIGVWGVPSPAYRLAGFSVLDLLLQLLVALLGGLGQDLGALGLEGVSLGGGIARRAAEG